MLKRMVASAVFAGFAAGLIAALLHFAFVQKLILLGEQYETGALTHFADGSDGHDHSAAEPAAPESSTDAPATDAPATATPHVHDAAEPSAMPRNVLTVLFMVLVYTAYGLLLTAGFGIADHFGRKIGAIEGMLWGLAGFATFQLAPAMGLAPELPGTIGADLVERQIWWWSTAAATGLGLAVLAYGPRLWAFGLAAALLALPHIIGAPEMDAFFGVAPPEVSAAFAARVLGTGLIVWSALGWLAGHFWAKSEQA